MTSRREAFRLLGITPDASPSEVRAAFRRKAIQHHPDTAASKADESTVRQLIEAYRLLTGSQVTLDESGRAAQQITVELGRAQRSVDSAQRPCRECRTAGFRIRIVTCPACRGNSLLTTIDIHQVKVFRCPRCQGRGRVPTLEVCRACKGTGVDPSRIA
jgi:DnaJ-class molecular chaperone